MVSPTKLLECGDAKHGVRVVPGDRKAFLIGGGIASLASAAYLIQAGGMPGNNIAIFEESQTMGGSLDGAGTADRGYVMRGGRMFTEEAYTCMFDLLSFIPSLAAPGLSVKDEFTEFNDRVHSHSHSRLIRDGIKIDASQLGLCNKDRMDIVAIVAMPEEALAGKRIEDLFEPCFFKTNFWAMWCTTFAFQQWHSAIELKRYLIRFMQEFPRIHTLEGVRRTPFNQYDSIVKPIIAWLRAHDVRFVMGSKVTQLDFKYGPDGKGVWQMHMLRGGETEQVEIGDDDLVFVTNGSMTAASSFGSTTSHARIGPARPDSSWSLWESLAESHSDFGQPSVFNGRVSESKWVSFTATLHDSVFFDLMEKFTGDKAGTGGLVTLLDSNWLLSIVLPYQPHFVNQPDDVTVFWGYGLFPDQVGNFVKKPMSLCTGEDLLEEVCSHLRFTNELPAILKTATCVPCMMPYITSQFMPREKGDRPLVRPIGTTNIAFIGQYCEIPEDVVFTVEYSVRSAQIAVYSLLGIDKEVSPIYKAERDIGIVLDSLKTLMH